MGTSLIADSVAVSRFFSDRAWIEGAALKQLEDVSRFPGAARLAAFPDLHPGKYGPVGIAADFEDVIHPALIGTDIGCGVTLAVTDLPVRKLRLDRAVDGLTEAMEAEADETLDGLGLGSIGGGNHFLELTAVDEVFDQVAFAAAGCSAGDVHVLVHTGSRSLGAGIFDAIHARHGMREISAADADAYLDRHDQAVHFAVENRRAVVDRALRGIKADGSILHDVPHNHVERVGSLYRHRKGASSGDRGPVMVLGSRGSLSYLVSPTGGTDALASLAHGSGRKLDRASARARFGGKGVIDRESRNAFGGRVVCNDKDLSAEEAAGAYKPVDRVIEDLVAFGLARPIATFRPLITWKTAGSGR